MQSLASKISRAARARRKKARVVVTIYDACIPALNKNTYCGCEECAFPKCPQLTCEVIGLQETRRGGRTFCEAAGIGRFLSWKGDRNQKTLKIRTAWRRAGCRVGDSAKVCIYTRLHDEGLLIMRFEMSVRSDEHLYTCWKEADRRRGGW